MEKEKEKNETDIIKEEISDKEINDEDLLKIDIEKEDNVKII